MYYSRPKILSENKKRREPLCGRKGRHPVPKDAAELIQGFIFCADVRHKVPSCTRICQENHLSKAHRRLQIGKQ